MPMMENGGFHKGGGVSLTWETYSIPYHIKTLYLFTKSDFKTVIVPQGIFAITTALSLVPSTSQYRELAMASTLARLLRMLAWMWIHLLVEDIANQRLAESVLEDKENKPWRPLPAGRITPAEAQRLLRALVPLAAGFSFCFGGYLASVTLMTLIWLYNDLDGASAGPFQRNFINAAGLACFGWGALSTLTAGHGQPERDSSHIYCWVALTATAVATTVFAQDFPDMAGDRARDRKTVPLLYPETPARIVLALLTLFWSVACLVFWDAVMLAWVGLLCVGGMMAVLTVCFRKQSCDEVVWKLWCAWVTLIYLLPAWRK